MKVWSKSTVACGDIKEHQNQITVMALITLVAGIASEAIPCAHILMTTLSQVVLLMLLLHMQQEHCKI